VFYGCRNHRYRQCCDARVTISREGLEQQLIAALSANLQRPELEEECIREFTTQLKARLQTEETLTVEAKLNSPKLHQERSELNKQAEHLVDAIAQHGISSFLSAQLATVESRIAEINRLLSVQPATKVPTPTDEDILAFLRQERQNFCDALTGNPEVAKREIQKHIKQLIMTPKETPDGSVLEVTGDVAMFVGSDVLVGVSLERFSQHDTPFLVSMTPLVLRAGTRRAPRKRVLPNVGIFWSIDTNTVEAFCRVIEEFPRVKTENVARNFLVPGVDLRLNMEGSPVLLSELSWPVL
jgi:hypothetical protein